jgi:ATP-dependent protease ClpP protease subunit
MPFKALATFTAALLLACSCAAPKHVSQIDLLLETTTPAITECSGVVKLGPIGDPDAFVSALDACKDQSVVVEINSPGGSVFAAVEIQKAIERHPHQVICVVDGMAASAAFVTLQACSVRAMTPRSVLMAHHASLSGASGKSEDLENAASALRAVDRAMTLFVCKRMGITPEAYEAHVSGNREWWLAADEAEKMNAIDMQIASVEDARLLLKP